MSQAGARLIEGAREALAIARGDQPAASIHVQGHRYISEAEFRRQTQSLRDQVDERDETIRQLRSELAPTVFLPSWLPYLQPKLHRLLVTLADGRLHSRTALIAALYENDVDAPEEKIIDVYVCKLRGRIGHLLTVKTVPCRGYHLTPQSVVALKGVEPPRLSA